MKLLPLIEGTHPTSGKGAIEMKFLNPAHQSQIAVSTFSK
tara:strand:- start:345 stop:464 length:120 start_codon:yes stop_codon:yes gene_type:complete